MMDTTEVTLLNSGVCIFTTHLLFLEVNAR